eukprot:2960486-Rhodomonas_salina.1
MTIVVRGNASYFDNVNGYGLELEDVVTVHVMEDDDCAPNCVFDEVLEMLAQPGDDTGLNEAPDEGYDLNQAFRFRVDRSLQRAYLEPKTQLLASCPFNPPRPSPADAFPATCITRRDIRFRGYPARSGGFSTGCEVTRLDDAGDGFDTEAKFMVSILGASAYAEQLGRDHARVIADDFLSTVHDGTTRRAGTALND